MASVRTHRTSRDMHGNDERSIDERLDAHHKWRKEELPSYTRGHRQAIDKLYSHLDSDEGLHSLGFGAGGELEKTIDQIQVKDHLEKVYDLTANAVIDQYMKRTAVKGRQSVLEELKAKRGRGEITAEQYHDDVMEVFDEEGGDPKKGVGMSGIVKALAERGGTVGELLEHVAGIRESYVRNVVHKIQSQKMYQDFDGIAKVELRHHAKNKYLGPLGGEIISEDAFKQFNHFHAYELFAAHKDKKLSHHALENLEGAGIRINPEKMEKHFKEKYEGS